MNARNIFALDEWVQENKGWIMQQNPTLKDIRAKAETSLGFKCSPEPIKSCMARHEIPVRRSKAEAERMMMHEQITELTDLAIDLFSYGNIPPEIAAKYRERLAGRGRQMYSRLLSLLDRQAQAAK